jgi:hypothetical protein
MKLVISSSRNAHHSVFFTQCSNNPELDKAPHEIFGSWYTTDTKIEPRTMPNSQDIDTLVLNSIESLMRDGASRKPDSEKRAPLTARDLRAAKRQQTLEDPTSSYLPLDGPSPSLEDQCNRTATHPLHTTSTTLPPKTINQWPALQTPRTSQATCHGSRKTRSAKTFQKTSSSCETIRQDTAFSSPLANALPLQRRNMKP